MAGKKITYKDTGVDIETGDEISSRISKMARKTFGPQVIDNPGGFAGLFSLGQRHPLFSKKLRNPVLVSCADGVGTKIAVAEAVGRHDTIGIDLVAMSVNDLVCTGATPIFFLDYVAASKLSGEKLVEVMKGVVDGCGQAGCALLGGETAEMPGFYRGKLYDLAGFAVGVAEGSEMFDRSSVAAGDIVIGIASNGLHSNGFSLVRGILKKNKLSLKKKIKNLGCTLGEELLKPTFIYSEAVRCVLEHYRVKKVIKGIAHITGGGLPGNVIRILPPSLGVKLSPSKWKRPPIFDLIKKWGGVDDAEMYTVFNMGIGMVIISAPYYAAAIAKRIRRSGFNASIIGTVTTGSHEVTIS